MSTKQFSNDEEQQLRVKLLDAEEDVEKQRLVKPTSIKVVPNVTNNSTSWTPIIVGGAIGLLLGGPFFAVIGALLGWISQKPGGLTSCCRCRCCCTTKCLLICVLICCTILGVIGYTVYGVTKEVVEEFTVTTPHAKFPIVDMSDAELDLVKDRVMLFVDSIAAHKSDKQLQVLEPLVLTQDEINGFISHSDYLRGNAMITLSEGKIQEEYSLPMDMFPGGEGRYFVGSDYTIVNEDTIELKMETAATHEDWFVGPIFFAQLEYLVAHDKETDEHFLKLFLQQGTLFGQTMFDENHTDLMDEFYHDENNKKARAILQGIERVSIHDGKIVVQPRSLN